VIVDTSALVAILFGEPDADLLLRRIQKEAVCRLSAGNYLEFVIVLSRQGPGEMLLEGELFLQRAAIAIEPVSLRQIELARHAYLDFGKGRHPAGLNFGDCFAYALAKDKGEPLLFKGKDFAQTDIVPAL
jgi:ribonuclease VapC